MGEVQTRARGEIIPFPGPESRPRPSEPDASEPRGRILLFMGVRYERRPDPAPSLSDGQGPSRRRRS